MENKKAQTPSFNGPAVEEESAEDVPKRGQKVGGNIGVPGEREENGMEGW